MMYKMVSSSMHDSNMSSSGNVEESIILLSSDNDINCNNDIES